MFFGKKLQNVTLSKIFFCELNQIINSESLCLWAFSDNASDFVLSGLINIFYLIDKF